MGYKERTLKLIAQQGHSSAPFRLPSSGGGWSEATVLSPGRPVPSSGQGSVILFHGTGNDAFFCHGHLVLKLLNDGLKVGVFDLPGHGRESTSILRAQYMAQVASDLAVGVAGKMAVPGPPPSLVGFSLGGALAMAARHLNPNLFGSVIAAGTPWNVAVDGRVAASEGGTLFTHSFWQRAKEVGPWNMMPAAGPFKRDVYPIRTAGEAHRGIDYVKIVNEVLADVRRLLAGSTDARIFHMIIGERDLIAPPSQGKMWQNLIKGASLDVLPGLNHFQICISDESADWIHDKIRSFRTDTV